MTWQIKGETVTLVGVVESYGVKKTLSEIIELVVTDFRNESESDIKRLNKANSIQFEDILITRKTAIAATNEYILMVQDFGSVYGATCACKDFIFRRRLESIPARPCKHLYKLYRTFQSERDRDNENKYTVPDNRLKTMLNLFEDLMSLGSDIRNG